MACTDCSNPNNDCGCTQDMLHISQVCNPIECESSECPEAQDAGCTVYAGEDIVCGNVIVVETGTSVAQALANIVAFVCSANDISFPKKFVFTGTLADPDDDVIIIPKTDLITCGLITDSCVKDTSEVPDNTTKVCDFVISGYVYNSDPDILQWVEFLHFDKSYVTLNDNGDIGIKCSFVPILDPDIYPVRYRIVIVG